MTWNQADTNLLQWQGHSRTRTGLRCEDIIIQMRTMQSVISVKDVISHRQPVSVGKVK